ncbi:hypothetical protein BOX15_Mlig007884g3 [Macrostomum lignano]|uniref:U3 small nucleolar RNA-associated protein 15 homolog n=2 Tax=Macrostomum lignano TaxID=282301 RepID=A0A1I8GPQ7_9PLAT|nr:hypothetical protein BOX15_Mlig007884g3 [Macrostomum lignano]
MAEFKGLSVSFAVKQKQDVQKQLFWPNLKNGPFNKLEDPVCCVKYCQSVPNFAVASGFQVEIRDPSANNAVVKNFHRFKSPVRSIAYRGLGSGLIAVGETNGHLSVHSVAMRTELRHMTAHTAAVTGLAFLAGVVGGGSTLSAAPKLASCAEDGRCLLWDVSDPQGQPLMEFDLSSASSSTSVSAPPADATAAAMDKATALDASQTDCNLLACGMINGRAYLLDSRQPRPALVLSHEHPVTCVRLAPGDNALYVAGDCWVRALSLHQGGRQIAAYRRHHKHVTDLAVGRGALLSCGLDGLVKVTDLLTYEEVQKYEYPNCGLLSMALSPGEADCLVLGTNDRWLLTRRYESPAAAAEAAEAAKSMSAAMKDPYLKAVKAYQVMPARPEDVVAPGPGRSRRPRQQLDQLDRLLKKFRHSDALSHVISKGQLKRKPQQAAAAMRELARRGALATALAGRPDVHVAALLKFVLHSLGNQDMAEDALPLASDLIEIYAAPRELRARPGIRPLFERLRALLAREIELGKQSAMCLGRVGLLLDTSAAAGGLAGSGGDAL